MKLFLRSVVLAGLAISAYAQTTQPSASEWSAKSKRAAEDAVASRIEMMELRPTDEVGYWALSGACQELKRYPEQIEACRAALCLNPNSVPSLEGLAWACAETGNCQEAVAALSHAIQIKPDLPHLHAWLAESFAELGYVQGAVEELKALAKLDPQLATEVETLIKQKGVPS
jgi:tetratricopeptide (TPR) repeat protein